MHNMGTWLVFLFLLFGQFLAAQISLTGTVTDEYGAPLAGANVWVSDTRFGAVADDKGRFVLSGLEMGTYKLQASYIGYESAQKEVTIAVGGPATVQFTLISRSIRIDNLVVTATRAGINTPMAYFNLSKEVLERNNLGQDVPYLLQMTPSAVVTSDAGTGIGYTGIRIRGTDPTRINVTINGVPINDAESQSMYWVDLPDIVSSTQDVQIQRGVGSSTNGAGAFGATINLNTSSVQKEAYATLNTSFGSFNTFKRNIQFGSGLLRNRFALDGRMSRVTSNGYIDRATADLQSYYFSGVYLAPKASLRFNVFSGHEVTYQAWNGVPADYVDDPELRTYNSAGTEKPGDPYENEVDNYRQTHYQWLYNQELGHHWRFNTTLHYTRGEGYYEQYKAEEDLADYQLPDVVIGDSTVTTTDLVRRRWLDNHFYGLVYALNYEPNARWQTTLGGSYSIYEGKHFGEVIWARTAGVGEPGHRYYDNDARKGDFNFYTKTNYQLLPAVNVYVDLQYRSVSYDFQGINNELQVVDQTDQLHFFNPKAGLSCQINERASAYASFAVANREPNRNDYTENSPANRPRPERLYNTEIGYRWSGPKAALAVNGYHMYYRDQLALNGQLNDVGEYKRVNIDRSYRLGLEVTGGWQMTPQLRLDANATLSRNIVEAFTEYVDVYDADFNWVSQREVSYNQSDLAFSPALVAGGELAYSPFAGRKAAQHHDLQLALLAKYIGKQYLDNSSDEQNTLDAYFFSDFRLRYRLQPRWIRELGLTLLVQNIFNAQIETNGWSYRYVLGEQTLVDRGLYPQAGTNVLVGLTVGI